MAGTQTTVRLPVAVTKSAAAVVFVAWTVKDVVAAGVEPEVVMVSVEVRDVLLELNETVLELKDAVAPAGNPVALRLALNEPVPPSRFTVIR